MAEKQPKRLEILTIVIGILVGLQTLGVFEVVRELLRRWILE